MPALFVHADEQPLTWRQGENVDAERFRAELERVAMGLPEAGHLFNLCNNRYFFMLGFGAAIRRRQITLMPPNMGPEVVQRMAEAYPDCCCLVDSPLDGVDLPKIRVDDLLQGRLSAVPSIPDIPSNQTVAIVCTSGSTGQPKPVAKSWGGLVEEARGILGHLPFSARGVRSLVATGPPRGIYGLTASVVLPWQAGLGVHSAPPLLALDVRDALARLPAPRVLITTPRHLEDYASAGLDWPEVAFVVCATAPLERSLAAETEQCMKTEVYEIFGSTETGSIAGRRRVRDDDWQLFSGMSITADAQAAWVQGKHLQDPTPINDRVEIISPERFRLLGSDGDLVQVDGTPASLMDLNHQLLSIPGVVDGVFVLPEQREEDQQNLAALVVAPGLTKQQLLKALAVIVDASFLPRPLHLVDRLPRTATGKLPREQVLKLLRVLDEAETPTG